MNNQLVWKDGASGPSFERDEPEQKERIEQVIQPTSDWRDLVINDQATEIVALTAALDEARKFSGRRVAELDAAVTQLSTARNDIGRLKEQLRDRAVEVQGLRVELHQAREIHSPAEAQDEAEEEAHQIGH